MEPIEVRFWSKVDIREPDECWPWLRYHKPRQCGNIRYNGESRQAPQIAWELTYNVPFPRHLDACHHCDNPPCCNPRHIYAGTTMQNVHDCIARGRFSRGEMMPMAVLNDDLASQLLQAYADKRFKSVRELAEAFRVNQNTLTNLLIGRTWKHIERPDRLVKP